MVPVLTTPSSTVGRYASRCVDNAPTVVRACTDLCKRSATSCPSGKIRSESQLCSRFPVVYAAASPLLIRRRLSRVWSHRDIVIGDRPVTACPRRRQMGSASSRASTRPREAGIVRDCSSSQQKQYTVLTLKESYYCTVARSFLCALSYIQPTPSRKL